MKMGQNEVVKQEELALIRSRFTIACGQLAQVFGDYPYSYGQDIGLDLSSDGKIKLDGWEFIVSAPSSTQHSLFTPLPWNQLTGKLTVDLGAGLPTHLPTFMERTDPYFFDPLYGLWPLMVTAYQNARLNAPLGGISLSRQITTLDSTVADIEALIAGFQLHSKWRQRLVAAKVQDLIKADQWPECLGGRKPDIVISTEYLTLTPDIFLITELLPWLVQHLNKGGTIVLEPYKPTHVLFNSSLLHVLPELRAAGWNCYIVRSTHPLLQDYLSVVITENPAFEQELFRASADKGIIFNFARYDEKIYKMLYFMYENVFPGDGIPRF